MKHNSDGRPQRKPLGPRDPNVLYRRLEPGDSKPRAQARMLVSGLMSNALVAREWSRTPFGDVEETVDFTTTLASVEDAAGRVARGDLSRAEGVLAAQLVTLNALFVNLAALALRSGRRLPRQRVRVCLAGRSDAVLRPLDAGNGRGSWPP
jgi:hypothetical protein